MSFFKMQIGKALLASFIILLSVSRAVPSSVDSSFAVVDTKEGKLKGTYANGIYSWKGVRYAKAPKGDLRFRAPEPVEKWKGIRDASSFGAIAPQITKVVQEKQPQSEDCLYLNIWSPAPDGKKRPVMFWIHGGGFVTGSGSAGMYDGTALAKKGDVVIVSINYRLGPLGFLYFNDLPNHAGFDNNIGMLDQVAALQWVHDNIAGFGGDPESVTIFGESAGAISVLTLMAMPSAKGLFNKAIVESAAPDDVWQPKQATEVTLSYLKMLHISPDSLSLLKKVPVDTLNAALVQLFKTWLSGASLNRTFCPTIDGKTLPTDLMSAASKNPGVALMIGTNKDEANLFAIKQLKMVPVTGEQLQPYLKKFSADERVQLISGYKDYPHKSGILAMITDGLFRVPSIRYADLHSAVAPTYIYRFDWASVPLKLYGLKACHGLELPFVFGSFNKGLGKKLGILTSKKRLTSLSNSIQTAWVNFARYGNPNAGQSGDWKKYDANSRPTLIFNNKIKASDNPDKVTMQTWKGLSIL